MTDSYQIAEVGKGIANHYRIDILKYLAVSPGASLYGMANDTAINYKTLSAHTARLHRSGLIEKKYLNHTVLHSLTPRGSVILKFLRNLE